MIVIAIENRRSMGNWKLLALFRRSEGMGNIQMGSSPSFFDLFVLLHFYNIYPEIVSSQLSTYIYHIYIQNQLEMASQNYPSSYEDPMQDMNVMEKIMFRSKQQPLVPIGVLATTAAVIMAAKGVRTGNAPKAQFWFRWRVALQGLTIVALVFGSYYYDRQLNKNQKTDEERAVAKAKVRQQLWIEELERRDQEMKDRQHRAELARQMLNEKSAKD